MKKLAYGISCYKKQIFLMKCYNSSSGNYYYRPFGGKIDGEESSFQAITREFNEELSIDPVIVEGPIEVLHYLNFNKKQRVENTFNFLIDKIHLLDFNGFKVYENSHFIGEATWVPVKDLNPSNSYAIPWLLVRDCQ